jgi:hypothetical protein
MFDSGGNGWEGATWEIIDLNSGFSFDSGTLASGSNESYPLVLPDGCYEITVGGGANDQEISWQLLYDLPEPFPDVEFLSGNAPDSQIFSLDEGCPEGCTDPLACNYKPSAILDDGSCCTGECITMFMTDSEGDGWDELFADGTEYTIYDGMYSVIANGSLEDGFSGTDSLCLETGCYFMTVQGGTEEWQAGWTLGGIASGDVSGGAPESIHFSVGSADCPGCTDPSNCLYSPFANTDDGTCCQETCLTLTIQEFSGSYPYTVRDVDTSDTLTTGVIYIGLNSEAGICLPDGCYEIYVEPPFFGSVDWQLSNTSEGTLFGNGSGYFGFRVGEISCPGCMDPLACNFSNAYDLDDGSCAYPGCNDPTACNYNSASGCDDGSCILPGCTNSIACNYDPLAGCDDQSCSFCVCENLNPTCNDNCIEVIMDVYLYEVSGDADFRIHDLITGDLVASSFTYGESGVDVHGFCLPDGCYSISASVFPYTYGEIYCSVYYNGTIMAWASSTPNSVEIGHFSLDDDSCNGCMDESACNYNPVATIDDDSCTYSGCTNPNAVNYDPQAGCDDGSCIILGCTYNLAINYNPEANDDDGSCLFDSPTCGSDLNGDGTINTADLLIFLSDYGTDCPE